MIAGQKLSIAPSMGIRVFPDHGTDSGLLLRLADNAMYEAKEAGRNTLRFHGGQSLTFPDSALRN